MKKTALLVCLIAGILIALSGGFGWAEVKVNPDFTGTLVITTPEGEIQLIETGEAIPPIPNGSVVEVFDGTFTVSSGPADSVKVSCLEHDANVGGGASMTLTCGENEGLAKVLSGTVVMTDAAGKQAQLNQDAEYPIKMLENPEQAPPTAAGEATGLPMEDMPGVDSRDIETSPAT